MAGRSKQVQTDPTNADACDFKLDNLDEFGSLVAARFLLLPAVIVTVSVSVSVSVCVLVTVLTVVEIVIVDTTVVSV